jgi:hypothetical protein
VDPRGRLKQALAKYEGLGLLAETERGVALTEKAVAVSNRIVGDVLEAFE